MTLRQATGRDISTTAVSVQGLALTVPAYFVQPRRLIKDLKRVLPAGTDAGFGHRRIRLVSYAGLVIGKDFFDDTSGLAGFHPVGIHVLRKRDFKGTSHAELDVHLASSRVLLLKPDEVRRRLAEQAAVGGAGGDGEAQSLPAPPDFESTSGLHLPLSLRVDPFGTRCAGKRHAPSNAMACFADRATVDAKLTNRTPRISRSPR